MMWFLFESLEVNHSFKTLTTLVKHSFSISIQHVWHGFRHVIRNFC